MCSEGRGACDVLSHASSTHRTCDEKPEHPTVTMAIARRIALSWKRTRFKANAQVMTLAVVALERRGMRPAE